MKKKQKSDKPEKKKKSDNVEKNQDSDNVKKNHNSDLPVLSKIVSAVTVIAICACTVCAVVSATTVSTPSAAPGVIAGNDGGGSNNIGGGNNANVGGQNSAPVNGNTADTPNDTQSGDNVGDSNASSKEEILAKYNEVVQNLKDNIAEYHKKEWQRMDDDYDMGTVGNLVMPIANNLMTSEADAEDQVRTDKEQIPLETNAKATIAPLSADNIKSATMTESGGKTTIVIVLNDEKDALPAEEGAETSPSFTGAMFNPISKSGIDNIISKFTSIATINKFELTYNNCTATLVFDTESLKVDTFEQIMPVRIDVDAKVKFPPISISGYATIINTTTVNQVTYK